MAKGAASAYQKGFKDAEYRHDRAQRHQIQQECPWMVRRGRASHGESGQHFHPCHLKKDPCISSGPGKGSAADICRVIEQLSSIHR